MQKGKMIALAILSALMYPTTILGGSVVLSRAQSIYQPTQYQKNVAPSTTPVLVTQALFVSAPIRMIGKPARIPGIARTASAKKSAGGGGAPHPIPEMSCCAIE